MKSGRHCKSKFKPDLASRVLNEAKLTEAGLIIVKCSASKSHRITVTAVTVELKQHLTNAVSTLTGLCEPHKTAYHGRGAISKTFLTPTNSETRKKVVSWNIIRGQGVNETMLSALILFSLLFLHFEGRLCLEIGQRSLQP